MNPKLVCPKCSVSLGGSSVKGFNLYSCPHCGGEAAGVGLLKMFLSPQQMEAVWERVKKAQTVARCCPRGDAPMTQLFMLKSPQLGEVELDICSQCHLVWFDQGERASLEKGGPSLTAGRRLNELYAEMGESILDSIEESRTQQLSVEAVNPIRALSSGEIRGISNIILFMSGLVPIELLQDSRNYRARWVPFISVVCVGVLIWSGTGCYSESANFGFRPQDGLRIKSYFTSIFFHGNWAHLVGNLLFLYTFGRRVESVLGGVRFGLLFILSGIAGNLFLVLFASERNSNHIGASGAIAGVVLYYCMRWPLTQMLFRYLKIPALFFAGLFFLQSFIGATLQVFQLGARVSYLSHLGGALVGVVFALIYSETKDLSRYKGI